VLFSYFLRQFTSSKKRETKEGQQKGQQIVHF